MPVFEGGVSRPLFDGRQLDRWGLSDSRLPPGSQVLFRPLTTWQRHKGEILWILAALATQSVFIVALFAAVRRRRRAEAQLRGVSARLLTAQEEERSRIAQELHDDVSQRLALLAIELDELGPQGTPSAADTRERAKVLGAKARTLSTEVHQIAYELHPAILDQLGLVPALRQFADQIATRHGIAIDVTETAWPSRVPRDVALVLYRIGQEALQNATKHSGAGEVHVSLRGSPPGVTLMVSDAGGGFDADARSARGQLGLVGMKERLRLVDGQLRIDSSASAGTVVAAFVPVNAPFSPPVENEPVDADQIANADGKAPHPAR